MLSQPSGSGQPAPHLPYDKLAGNPILGQLLHRGNVGVDVFVELSHRPDRVVLRLDVVGILLLNKLKTKKTQRTSDTVLSIGTVSSKNRGRCFDMSTNKGFEHRTSNLA